MIDIERGKRIWRRTAPFYNVLALPSGRLRGKAIARLALRPGETVLDFGCGTGLSFDLLERSVGPEGRVIGVELSPEMLARARERAARHGWTNVTLIEANAEEVDLPAESVDAVLSAFTNDIMHSRLAVERAVRALRVGGRFVAAGVKTARGLRGLLVNPITLGYSLPFITMRITASPWSHLEDLLGPLELEEHLFGSEYIAYGVKKAA